MFIIFIALQALFAGELAAAPLESGFALAPKASASQAEKDAAYQEARSRLLTAAGKYEHTPYRYGGLDKRGLDCSGFVFVSFLDALGISVPRNAESLYSWVEKIPIDKAQPGDLVFFRTTKSGKISHVGILTSEGRFIHSASEGPVTGVMYSRLDEKYWSRTYAGAGRALPATGTYDGADRISGVTENPKEKSKEKPSAEQQRDKGILIGFAAAPTWNTYFANSNVIRGAAGQFRFGVVVRPFGQQMILGAEVRPEWDSALGVFRLPFTLSWGLNDRLRIFAGPVLSFGSAALDVSGENRLYSGGTSWLGAAGLTFSPFTIKIARADFAPYGEVAWQSYFNNSSNINIGADFAAGFRFSTGLRVTWRI
ncbi:MAG: C40 family peptidase [Treponema sp.]|jgi:probable lipoprotein NlpC|nr:C40 family peptidase [Treponema sp.]